jgi:hypothetical protein
MSTTTSALVQTGRASVVSKKAVAELEVGDGRVADRTPVKEMRNMVGKVRAVAKRQARVRDCGDFEE